MPEYGISKMVGGLTSAKLPAPLIEEFQGGVRITIRREAAAAAAETVAKTVEKPTEKTVEKILAAIALDPHITQKQLAVASGLSRRGIEWNLKKMQTLGMIQREGGARGGRWIIL